MTLVKITKQQEEEAKPTLFLHSPCEISTELQTAINQLGNVAYIVAPGTYHHLHVESAQAAFPDAETYICPGIEAKRPDIVFDWILGDRPPPQAWGETMDQVLIRGNRMITEVVFYHKPTQTLLITDVLENIGDATSGSNWYLKFWFQYIFRMWDNPKPAPEYQVGWINKPAAAKSLNYILESWDFERIILAHGDLLEGNEVKSILQKAWEPILKHKHDKAQPNNNHSCLQLFC